MKTIAIIPARGGSKRLPEKNVLPLGGVPLIVHSIRYAKAHGFIDSVYVSTDDEEIKKIALEHEAKVIDRPAALSGDHEPTVSALKHVLEYCGEEIDNVILLQPTNPLRPENLLGECFEVFQKQNAESLFTVSRNHQKFGKIFNDKFIPFNYKPGQRSQDLEPLYFENGLLYICKSAVILRNEIMTEDAFPFITNHIFSAVDIDTKEDLDYAEYLYKTHQN
jgi:CMP-N-acetylneuraminic acid synthetase